MNPEPSPCVGGADCHRRGPNCGAGMPKRRKKSWNGSSSPCAPPFVIDVLRALHHLHVHDRRAVALDEGREIRQREMRLRGDGAVGTAGGALGGGRVRGLGSRAADASRQHDGNQTHTDGLDGRGKQSHVVLQKGSDQGRTPMPNRLASIVEVPSASGLRICRSYDRRPLDFKSCDGAARRISMPPPRPGRGAAPASCRLRHRVAGRCARDDRRRAARRA